MLRLSSHCCYCCPVIPRLNKTDAAGQETAAIIRQVVAGQVVTVSGLVRFAWLRWCCTTYRNFVGGYSLSTGYKGSNTFAFGPGTSCPGNPSTQYNLTLTVGCATTLAELGCSINSGSDTCHYVGTYKTTALC